MVTLTLLKFSRFVSSMAFCRLHNLCRISINHDCYRWESAGRRQILYTFFQFLHKPYWLIVYCFIEKGNQKNKKILLCRPIHFHAVALANPSTQKLSGGLPHVMTFELFPCQIVVCAVWSSTFFSSWPVPRKWKGQGFS